MFKEFIARREQTQRFTPNGLSNTTTNIIEGDCREKLREIADDSVDLIVTSPPYADQRKATYGGVKPEKYVEWFIPISQELLRVLKPSGTFILNIKEKSMDGERHTYVLDLIKALREQGWRWTEEFIWRKTSSMPGKWRTRLRDGWERLLQFNKTSEFAMYQDAVKKRPTESTIRRVQRVHTLMKFHVQSTCTKRHTSSTGSGFIRNYANQSTDWVLPDNVLELSTEPVSQKHSAVFPKGIPEFFIKLFTAEGDTVLDPFLGSGTSGLVARELGRNFIGIEAKPEYVQVAKERVFGEIAVQ
jgi:DNA modification methylase